MAVWTVAADTDEEARRLALSARASMAMLRRGRLVPVPPPAKAARILESLGEDPATEPRGGRRTVVGTGDAVRAGLEQVAAEYGAEEVIAVTITHDHQARRRSYELIADAFGLPSRNAGDGRADTATPAAPPVLASAES